MNRTVFRSVVIALGIGVAARPALATQVILQTPKELARASSLIVDGKVAGVRSYWNEDHSKIFTETTVTVGATHKGTGASAVRVLQLGGVVGNVRQTAHGALSWHKGEEVLLFLEPATPGTYQVAGFSQGKFAIERDARTGKAFVRQAGPADGGASATSAGASAAPERRVTLEQFLNDVLPKK